MADPIPTEAEIVESKITTEEAKKALLEERQQRVKACDEAITEVLKEYKCGLTAIMIVSQNGNTPQVQIVTQE